MKRRTKIILLSTGTVLALGVAGGGFYVYQNFVPHKIAINENATAKSNFYQYINKDYLIKTEIPSDQPEQDDSYKIQNKIEKQLISDLDGLASGDKSSDLTGMNQTKDYYKLASDSKKLEKNGTEPAKAYLKRIEELDDYGELNSQLKELSLEGFIIPFTMGIGARQKNTDQKILYFGEGASILPDTSYYEDKATAKQYFDIYKESAVSVLEAMGYDKNKADDLVDATIRMDKKMAKTYLSTEEKADDDNTYHEVSISDLASYSDKIDLEALATALVGHSVDTVNVVNLDYYKAFNEIFSEANFDDLKSWMLVRNAMDMATYLDRDTQEKAAQYTMKLSGQSEMQSADKIAYYETSDLFSEPLSTYYGKSYFGDDAKEDVTQIVDNIVASYKTRLRENEWLSDETKAKAIEKLDSMTYQIGYGDDAEAELYDQIEVDENSSLLENTKNIFKIEITYEFSKFDEPVEKGEFDMPSYEINAQYSQDENAFVLPAAILQAPYYSSDSNAAANYGGIGVVIGHEISHAFDSEGAKYDKEGNKINWWTDKDRAAFKDKTNALIKQWDGLKLYDIAVNAKQTVTENAADLSGVNVALQTLQTEDRTANLKDFFVNYATIWRKVATTQYYQYILSVDTHAPAELRVNQVLKNINDFYDIYGIKKGDSMYLPEDKRLTIW
ncbi:M13-type metalloendopeptidase [Streptococcus dentiloxodontae]